MATASFLGFDTTTLGDWTGAYGANGRGIANDGATTPVGSTITVTVGATYTWDSAPLSPRALIRLSLASRIASAWYDGTAVKLTATGTSGTQRIHLYLCDWDNFGRAATLNVYDNGTSALLDTQTVSNAPYVAGVWASWEFTGDIRIEVVNTTGGNSVVNGWFLGGDPAATPPPSNLSQLPLEVLRGDIPVPPLRLSQLPTEILRGDQPDPLLRISQLPVEVLRGDQPTPTLRLSQLPIEVLRHPTLPGTLVSDVTVEVLSLPIPASRVTEIATELLSLPIPAARVTELSAELLSLPIPASRVTDLSTELLSLPIPAARVTDLTVEVLNVEAVLAPARVTQTTVEVLQSAPTTIARITQTTVEVLQSAPPTPARITQATVELLQSEPPPIPTETLISQATVEILQASLSPTRVSQVAIETLSKEPSPPSPAPTGSTFIKYLLFAKQGGTGTQSVDGVGFQGKALLIWSSRMAGAGATAGAQQSLGMTDSLMQSARFIQHPNAASSSAQAERRDCIVLMTNASEGSVFFPGTVTTQVQGVFAGWTEDGFSIDWTVNDGAFTQFHVIVIGGDDIQLKLKQVKITNIGVNTTLDVEGVGFEPDSFIVMGGASDESSVPGSESGSGNYSLGAPFGSMHGFGFSNAVDNICSWTLAYGGTTVSRRGLHTNRVASIRTANLTSFDELCGLQITATHPDGFTLTRKDATTHIFPVQHIICIKGAAFRFGTFNSPATPSDLIIPLDFQAGLFIAQTHGSSTLDAPIAGMGLMMGAWVTPVQQGGTWIGGLDGVSPVVFARSNFLDKVIEVRSPNTMGVTCEASVVASTITGVQLHFTTVPATPITFLFMALGAVISPLSDEALFDPDASPVGLTWVEFTDSTLTRHVWANIALPDPPNYYYGYKEPRLLEWNSIRRGLSNYEGAHEGSVWSWNLSDADRAIRRLLGNELTKWFFNRNVVGRTITDAGRRALQTPRTIFRGVVRDWQPGSGGEFSFAAEDYLVMTFQIGTDERACPKRSILLADFPSCPEENLGRPVPVIYGKLSDTNQTTTTVPGVPGSPGSYGLLKPANLTATRHGPSGSATYTYGVTALDDRNRTGVTDHAGETDAAYVTITNAPDLDEMQGYTSSTQRYVELDWDSVPGAERYRVYGRQKNGGTSLCFLDSARGPESDLGGEERYNDGMRHNYTEVDILKCKSHPPASNNTFVGGDPGIPESSVTTDTGRGLIPVVFVGTRDIGGAIWNEFLVCGHAIKSIIAVYQAIDVVETESTTAKAEPKEPQVVLLSAETDAAVYREAPAQATGGVRVPDAECNLGGSLLVPGIGNGWSSTIGSQNYRVYNDRRYTVIYARNTIGEKAALNEQPIFINVHGIETSSDGTGTLIESLPQQYLHALQNWILGDYQNGAWLASPVFPDDTSLPQIDSTSFALVKTQSEARIAGGYVGAAHFGVDGEFQSVRDVIQKFNVSCDVNSGFNFKTQFMVSMQSDTLTFDDAHRITQERDILRESFAIESLVDEFFNRIHFKYGLLPENGAFMLYSEVKNQDSINASLEMRSSQLRELPYVRNAPVGFDIARRFLQRSKEVPRLVSWEMGMSGLNFELGDIVLVTHADGIGDNGYVDTPMRITRQDYNPQNYTVSIEAYDVGVFFADKFILGDETALPALWTTATTTQRAYGYLGDETTGMFSDGVRAKRLR